MKKTCVPSPATSSRRRAPLGADEADAYIRSGVESTVSVRKQEIEKLIEAGSRSVSIRVIKDKRTAVCNTSDLTPKALDEMVRTAVELATISEPDEFAGLPAKEDLATDMGGALQLYDERIESLTVDEMKDIVLRAEQAAFDFDKRITNSEGAEFGAERGMVVLANTLGFCGSFPYTAASFSVSVLADDAERQEAQRLLVQRRAHVPPARRGRGRRTARGRARRPQDRRPQGRDARSARRLGADDDRRAHGHHRRRGERRVAVQALDVPHGLRGHGDRVAAGDASSTTLRCPASSARARSTARACARGATCCSRAASSSSSSSTATTLAAPAAARRAARRAWAIRSASARGNLIWEAGAVGPGGAGRRRSRRPVPHGPDGVRRQPDDWRLLARRGTACGSRTASSPIPSPRSTSPATSRDMLQDIDAVGNDLEWRAGTASPTIRMSRLTVSGL